ncbi:tRNA-modifying protein like protein [Tanacetum coccineum]
MVEKWKKMKKETVGHESTIYTHGIFKSGKDYLSITWISAKSTSQPTYWPNPISDPDPYSPPYTVFVLTIPMTAVTEVGHNTAIGFVWVRRKTKSQHLFSEIGRKVSYYVEVTAFVEEGRMRNLTGVKSKELLIWVRISDIFVGDHNNGKITFGTSSGLSRTFLVSAFQ